MNLNFLRKIFFNDNPTENIDTLPEKSPTAANDQLTNDPQAISEQIPQNAQFAPTSVNLMNRFLRTQKAFPSEPPENFHENEAWAPEIESVGLFRKRRLNPMEQSSSDQS
jgi:hypothetical protein